MKNFVGIALIIVVAIGGFYFLGKHDTFLPSPIPSSNSSPSSGDSSEPAINSEPVSVIAENLDTPWGIVFLPDKSILVTERQGSIRRIDAAGKLDSTPVATLANVKEIGEGGLLGITIHPQFKGNHYIYVYYTYSSSGDDTLNRVVRMKYENNKLGSEQIVVERIPGASNHNGGRIKFGPDGLLYIGTGDAQEPSQSQNTKTLGGKILRVTAEGKPAPGNPFNNEVYSYGHRNVQGLAWDNNGQLWATEHGRSGIASGYDELNRIEAGKNYGWPDFEGDKIADGMVGPKRHSGASKTWAPAGLAFVNGSFYFGGLRGQELYKAGISGTKVTDFAEYFSGGYGRIREVVIGPDGMLYISTSNKDGRGSPGSTDDRIIRVNPVKL